jgi:hypothetical protein
MRVNAGTPSIQPAAWVSLDQTGGGERWWEWWERSRIGLRWREGWLVGWLVGDGKRRSGLAAMGQTAQSASPGGEDPGHGCNQTRAVAGGVRDASMGEWSRQMKVSDHNQNEGKAVRGVAQEQETLVESKGQTPNRAGSRLCPPGGAPREALAARTGR